MQALPVMTNCGALDSSVVPLFRYGRFFAFWLPDSTVNGTVAFRETSAVTFMFPSSPLQHVSLISTCTTPLSLAARATCSMLWSFFAVMHVQTPSIFTLSALQTFRRALHVPCRYLTLSVQKPLTLGFENHQLLPWTGIHSSFFATRLLPLMAFMVLATFWHCPGVLTAFGVSAKCRPMHALCKVMT